MEGVIPEGKISADDEKAIDHKIHYYNDYNHNDYIGSTYDYVCVICYYYYYFR